MARLRTRPASPSATASSTPCDDVSLDVADGEFLVLLGPSGCGKTTTLAHGRRLRRADAPAACALGGRDITALPPWKRNTGMVFQSYALFPHMTVAENVAFGLEMRKIAEGARSRRARHGGAAAGAARAVSRDRLPRQLSGGQQQRVALARALVFRPDVLLLDEPLSNLDAKLRQDVRVEIRELQRQLGLTTVMVTHDQEEALTMADRLVVMAEGEIRQIGSAARSLRAPGRPLRRRLRRPQHLPAGPHGWPRALRDRRRPVLACASDAAPAPAALALRPERLRCWRRRHRDGQPLRRHGGIRLLSRARCSSCMCACRPRTAWSCSLPNRRRCARR